MARTHVEEGENWVSYVVLDLHTCTMSLSTQTHTKKWILKKLKKNHLYIKQKKLFLLQTVFPHVNSHRLLKDRGDQLWRWDPVKHPEHYGGRIFLETRQGRQCKWCRVWPQVDTKKQKGAAECGTLPSQTQRGPVCSCISYAGWSAPATCSLVSVTVGLPLCFDILSKTKALTSLRIQKYDWETQSNLFQKNKYWPQVDRGGNQNLKFTSLEKFENCQQEGNCFKTQI